MAKFFVAFSLFCAAVLVLSAAPVLPDFSFKPAYADSHKGDKETKEKREKKEKKSKECSREDQDCNDQNANRKSEEKSHKGGKSDEMKAKGKKK